MYTFWNLIDASFRHLNLSLNCSNVGLDQKLSRSKTNITRSIIMMLINVDQFIPYLQAAFLQIVMKQEHIVSIDS